MQPTTIAFQGTHGSYHELSVQEFVQRFNLSEPQTTGHPTFKEVLKAYTEGQASAVVVGLENNTMGRTTDLHNLLPEFYAAGLRLVGENYMPIHHCFAAMPGQALGDITDAYSQNFALTQCAEFMHTHSLVPHATADTAGAAKMIAKRNLMGAGAICSTLAAKHYGLEVLAEAINDNPNNTTRFGLFMPEDAMPLPTEEVPCKTTLLFTTRHIPAALYKALGGFATNGLNLSRLESYVHSGQTTFYVDVDAHLSSLAMENALDELNHFCSAVQVLGCYTKQG